MGIPKSPDASVAPPANQPREKKAWGTPAAPAAVTSSTVTAAPSSSTTTSAKSAATGAAAASAGRVAPNRRTTAPGRPGVKGAVPTEDFDFEAMNQQFSKRQLEEEERILNQMKFEKKYDKGKSFFDELVPEKEESKKGPSGGGGGRITMKEQLGIDVETFGDVAKHYRPHMDSRNAYRGGGRGGSRGGSSQGRGGSNTARSSGPQRAAPRSGSGGQQGSFGSTNKTTSKRSDGFQDPSRSNGSDWGK